MQLWQKLIVYFLDSFVGLYRDMYVRACMHLYEMYHIILFYFNFITLKF